MFTHVMAFFSLGNLLFPNKSKDFKFCFISFVKERDSS
jgi:hypothetical protein